MDERLARLVPDTSNAGTFWLAVLAGCTMAVGVIMVWWAINDRAREHIASAALDATRINQLLIRQDIDHRISALERLAQRWTAAGGTPRAVWNADAASYVADMPGFQAIEWADATLHVRWTVPLAGNEAALGLDITQTEQARIAVTAARRSGRATLTRPLELAQGGLGITVYSPVTRNKQFDGAIAGVIRLDSWLAAVIARVQSSNYNVRILLEGQEVYRQYADDSIDETWTERSDLEVHGLTWTTLVTPTREFVSAVHTGSSTLMLVVGLLLSTLVAVVVYLALDARQRSRQLHQIASRLATLFQNLPGMAYRCTGQRHRPMEFVSEGCEKISGYSRSDFEEQRVHWAELIHAEDRDRIWREMRMAIDVGEAFELEYRVVTKGGDERWMWERGRAVTTKLHNDTRLEGFVSDITNRKIAEMALIEARAFSEAVVDTAVEAVITIDANGKIETFNRAAQQMFGYTLEDVQGKNVGMLIPGLSDSKHDQFIARYLQTGEATIIGKGREESAQRREGGVFPVHLSVSEIRNRKERKFVGLIRDISRQRAAEDEARQHRDLLAHTDRVNMLGEMATGIAHEINQPLTAISLFAQAGMRLFGGGENLQRLPEIFEKLTQHAHRASAVIQRMQAMARRQESTKEVVDFNALADDVAKLAESEARIRDITVSVHTQENLPPVAVDTVQIQQVALNLLRNGMEAMQSVDSRKGDTISLQTKLRDNGDVELAVVDTGCGVSEEVAKVLFSPFSTTKESGMGMGLSICRAIITAHGGHIDFFNNDEGGATFFFTLPAADSEEQNG